MPVCAKILLKGAAMGVTKYRILRQGEIIRRSDEGRNQFGNLDLWDKAWPNAVGKVIGEYKGSLTSRPFEFRRPITLRKSRKPAHNKRVTKRPSRNGKCSAS
jgi:hypothetical protein